MLFEPLELVARLAALVPQCRVNTLRYHGVYAAHAKLRPVVVSSPPPRYDSCSCGQEDPVQSQVRLSWAQLLKRVFAVDVFSCPRCGSRMSRIAWIVGHDVVRKILRAVGLPTEPPLWHPPRSVEDLFTGTRLA